MALMDHIQTVIEKVLPARSPRSPIPAPVSMSASGGIGAGRGMASFEDDMIVSKPAIIFHAAQIFFNFLALACFASVASFQAKWKIGPSGLSGFAIFIAIAGILLSLFMLLVPVLYEKYDKFNRLARALKEVRVGFILAGTGTSVSLLIAFIVTISAWTEPGCKDASKDPNASKGSTFQSELGGWCSTKKAAAVFFWFTFGFWLATLTLAVLDWRNGKLTTRPRDPPFTAPSSGHDDQDDIEGDDDDESTYENIAPLRQTDNSNAPNSPFADAPRRNEGYGAPGGSTGGYATPPAAQPRPSMDAYGAFSDPPPSGFSAGNAGTGGSGPVSPAGMSRTMQYADPYAAVRATIASAAPAGAGGAVSPSGPPSYEYTGYR